MGSALTQVMAVIFAAFAFVYGGGLFSSITSLRGAAIGFDLSLVGALGSIYYLGFLLGCLCAPPLIKRNGHIRALAVAAAIGGTVPLLMLSFESAPVWLVARFFNGIAFSVLYTIVESWINDRAENAYRGRILSIYVLFTHFGNVGGQGSLAFLDPLDDRSFYLVVALFVLSLVPVALTRAINPTPPDSVKINLKKLWARSPVAWTTALLNGAVNGALWIVGPIVIAQQLGTEMVGWLMPCFLIGGIFAQWPLGRASDFTDRRRVLLLAAILAAGGACIPVFFGLGNPWLTALALFISGSGGMSVYSVALAHANDRSARSEAVEMSGGMLLLYGIGAILGPTLTPFLAGLEGRGLFIYVASAYAAWMTFIIWRMTQRERTAEVTETATDYPVQHGPALANPDLRILAKKSKPAKKFRTRRKRHKASKPMGATIGTTTDDATSSTVPPTDETPTEKPRS